MRINQKSSIFISIKTTKENIVFNKKGYKEGLLFMTPKLASISINFCVLSKMKKNPLDCSSAIIHNKLFNFDIKDRLSLL